MDQFSLLFQQYQTFGIALIISIPRVYAFMNSSQLFNRTSIPGMPRTASILSLTFVVVPVNLAFAKSFDRTIASYIILFAKEYAIGVVLGYFVAWIFWVLQSAGSLIDNQRGASIASSIDPLLGADSTPLGNLLSLAFTTYIFATGSVLQVIGLLFASFKIWPVSRWIPAFTGQFPALILTVFDYSMKLGFNIAAPIVAVMFLAEFSLAMISRFSPQVQVFVLAMPIKSLLAIMMLIFYASILLPYANHQLLSINGVTNQLYNIFGFGETLRHRPSYAPAGGATP